MNVGPIDYEPAQEMNVRPGDALRIREDLGHVDRHGHLVDAQVGVGRNDGARAKVDALAAQVAAEAALLALQTLAKAARELLRLHAQRYAYVTRETQSVGYSLGRCFGFGSNKLRS